MGNKAKFRYLGIIAAIFAISQIVLIIICSIIGIILFCVRPDYYQTSPILYAYSYLYFSHNAVDFRNFISPSVFFFILWIILIIHVVWCFFSVKLIQSFLLWINRREIETSITRWLISTLIVIIFDLLIFFMFFIEIRVILADKLLLSAMRNEIISEGPWDDTNENTTENFHRAIIKRLTYRHDIIFFYSGDNKFVNISTSTKSSDFNISTSTEYWAYAKDNPFIVKVTVQDTINNPFMRHADFDLKEGIAATQDKVIPKPAQPGKVTKTHPDVIYGVWSWFVVPAALTMTLVMKFYIGWLANVVLLVILFQLNKERKRIRDNSGNFPGSDIDLPKYPEEQRASLRQNFPRFSK